MKVALLSRSAARRGPGRIARCIWPRRMSLVRAQALLSPCMHDKGATVRRKRHVSCPRTCGSQRPWCSGERRAHRQACPGEQGQQVLIRARAALAASELGLGTAGREPQCGAKVVHPVRAPAEVGGYSTAAGGVPIGGCATHSGNQGCEVQQAERDTMVAIQWRATSAVCLKKCTCASERHTVSSVNGGAGATHPRLSSLSSQRPLTLPPRHWELRPRPSAHRHTYLILMAIAAVDRAESPVYIP